VIDAQAAFAPIPVLADRLRNGAFSSRELTAFFLQRCEQLGPKYNAVVTLTADRGREEADRADAELTSGVDRGPLHGLPYAVKDLLATRGYPTSWGAAPFKDQVIDEDASVVRRLGDAGAVLVAKLAMVEIAGGMGYRQANASFTGPGRNPWDPTRWSGGSSSGPGSAVAAGLVPFAIGSETWGSIMTPAAYCGITGLRPTYGRVSRHGAMALSWTMDKLGPLAHTAEDCGIVLAAIAGPDPEDDSSVDRPFSFPGEPTAGQPFRLATLKGAADNVQPEVAANYSATLEVLGEFCTFEETELPDLPYNATSDLIISSEAAAAFEDLVLDGRIQEMTAEEDRWRIYGDLGIRATDYINALRVRKKIQRALDEVLSRYDAIVTPTLVSVAGPVDKQFGQWRAGYTSSNIGGAGNAAGIPAISVPNGFDDEGLPTGLQLVGRAFEESRLLTIAAEYQKRTDWHERHPDVE
jgi:Asp-tRNA(Asn)/Glu-tRNA(Gln) amidotransferase A subunit family amidase